MVRRIREWRFTEEEREKLNCGGGEEKRKKRNWE